LQGGSENADEPAYIISSSYFDTNGYRDHSSAHKVLNNAKLTWNLEDGSKINWMNNYVKIAADDPGGLERKDWKANPKQIDSRIQGFNTRKEIEQFQTGLTWNKSINDQHELYGMAYWGQREVIQYQSISKFFQSLEKQPGGVIDFDRQFYGADLRWTDRDVLPNTKLIAGLAVDAMTEDRKGYLNYVGNTFGVKGELRRDEDNTLWNADPYLQISYNFMPDWTLDAGLRYSNVHFKSEDHYITDVNGDNSGKTTFDKLLPSLSLSWKILPELMTYASYAQGFETPTFTEMAYPASGSFDKALNLKAAESETYELGLKSANILGDFTVAVFQTKTKNDIVSAGNDNGRSTFRNADKTLREGIELSWNKNLWRDLTAQASYSYLDATFDKDTANVEGPTPIQEGNYIPGIAKNQAFLSLGWKPEQGLRAGVDIRYSDKIYVDDKNSDAAPSYTVAGANVGYHWKMQDWAVNTFARVDNLFDKDYSGSVIVNESNNRFFEPAEGRNWSAGLSVTKEF
jgi:iron complex outermembrane receptor protein